MDSSKKTAETRSIHFALKLFWKKALQDVKNGCRYNELNATLKHNALAALKLNQVTWYYLTDIISPFAHSLQTQTCKNV